MNTEPQRESQPENTDAHLAAPVTGDVHGSTGRDAAALCDVCGAAHSFRWTDSHGVGVCYQCAAPYTIFHYDEDKTRLDKAPEIALNAEGVMLARRYWQETQRKVFPGCYDMGILGNRETTYSGATRDDAEVFNEWLDRQPEVIAAAALAAATDSKGAV